MDGKILRDENGAYEFDFTKCDYVIELHELAIKLKLNDVDFISKMDNKIVFIEYKNSNIDSAKNPTALSDKIKNKPQKFYENIASKHKDSLYMLWANKINEEDLDIEYILLIEDKVIDKKLRNRLQQKIGNHLPLELKNIVKRNMISRFEVLNLNEFTEKFKKIKISKVVQ